VSDGNEANGQTPVSRVSGTNAVSDGNEANGQSPVSDDVETPDAAQPHEPHIRVLKGNPTDEEVAALIAVLGSAGGGVGQVGQPEVTRWGLPVDKLRYSIFSWQKLTLVQRTHMRR
jgi:Acyl-CoA carboxylase epsilon subunit